MDRLGDVVAAEATGEEHHTLELASDLGADGPVVRIPGASECAARAARDPTSGR
jgi:hypothetical protein